MKKRLLSWLLVLTMVVSLIPSTLVTALAAELPSVQAATSTNGKTTYELTNSWPTDDLLEQYDIVDVKITSSVAPGATVTVKDGQTLIFHGTGFLADSSTNLTPLVVESGGHLVLDELTIQNNGVASTGAVYVKNGGLLDLGYNARSSRHAPSITNNTVNATARNLVIEDGATVRLNAAAEKAIGVSYVTSVTAPVDILQGGRYTIQTSDTKTIVADDNTLKTVEVNDHIVLRQGKAKILVWNPANWGNYVSTTGIAIRGLRARLQEFQNQNIAAVTTVSGSRSTNDSFNQNASYSYKGLTDYTEQTLKGFDLIYIVYPFGVDKQANFTSEMQKLGEYLNSGGRIVLQGENVTNDYIPVNSCATSMARALGGGFTLSNSNVLQGFHTAKINDHKLTKGLNQINVGSASPIIADTGTSFDSVIEGLGSDGKYYPWYIDQLGGTTEEKWGRLTIISDSNFWGKSEGFINDNVGKTLLTNMLNDTMDNRVLAATGVNPNAEFEPEASTTTTTTTTATDYRTPYAALQKAVEGNTVTLLLKSREDTGITPVSDELLFENATLAYEQGSTYVGSTIYADTAGVYVDITQTGEVNLRSGTVKVTPKDKDYVLTLGGTGLNTDGTAIEGGYKITAPNAYTLDADDEKSPILEQNGGGASVTLANVGDSVTVTYTGGENGKLNGKTVTYTATEANEKFYLGCYTVNYQTDASVTWTADDLAWDGHDFNAKMTPATGFEGHGEKLVVVNQDSPTHDNYEMEPGATEGSGNETWGLFQSKATVKDGQPKITVKQQYLHTNGVDHNGYATLTVRNVRADIIIRTVGDVIEAARPDIYVVGVGVKDGQKTQLWAYTTQRTTDDRVTTKDVEGWPWAKWKVVGAKTAMGNQTTYKAGIADDQWTDQTIKDSTTAGGALCPVELTHGDMVVEFEYEWDMVDVKINAKLGSSTDPDSAADFPGYAPQYAELQRDVKGTIYAPNLSGYQAEQTSMEFTPTVGTDGKYGPYEVTFYYTVATSLVTYRAVDAEGHELATWDGQQRVAKGDTILTGWALAPKLAGYQVTHQAGVATANGQTVTQYDGINPVTVTWVYESKTRDVEIKMVEYKADGDHRGAELRTDTTSYANSPVGFTLNLSAPAIPGYTVKEDANNAEISKSKSVFVEDNDQGKLTVYFYYEVNTTDDAKVTVQLWDKVNDEEIWSYTIPGQNGEKQLVRVPTVKGYVSDPSNKDTSIAPDDTLDAGWGKGTVRFLYSPNTVTVKVKLVDSTKTAGDTDYELNSKLTNYKGSYTVVKGESVDIVAPDIYGYTLKDTSKSVYTVIVNANETKTEIEEIIEYVPISNQMVNIKVTGTVDGGNDLYTYTVQVAAGSKEYTIDAKQNIPGYKLSGATVGSNNVFDQVKNDQLTVTVPDNAKGDTVLVTLTYKSTKTTVTVKAMCGQDELSEYTVEKEIGAETSVFAPSIPGYTATEQTKTFTPDGTADTGTQTFQYTKNTGNVVLIAKAGNTELFRKDGGTKAKDETINASDFTAPTVSYYERTNAEPTIQVGGKAFNSGDQYDGIGQIEITYEYQRKTASVTIVKKDADTRKQIETQKVTDLPVGETHAFNQTVTTPTGYTPVTNDNPSSVFVEDSTNQQVVFWYRQNENDRYVSITVNLKCGGNVFETYTVRAIKGQETTVGRPTWTGYTPVQNEQGYQTVTPQDDTTVVEFNYTLDDPKTITIKLHNNTDNADMTTPNGYQTSYILKNGDEITIQAPIMSGFTLNGYTISGGSNGTSQFVTVTHGGIQNGTVITFNYESVENANFVKHNVRFVDHQNNELYSYDKMVPKGTGAGTKIEYKESDVKYLIPGYTLKTITYKVAGNAATADQVTNLVDAEITYVFDEATAKIIVEQYNGDPDNGGTKLSGDVELTGYRIGQENIVVTAPARTDMALKDSLTKTVTGPLAATQTVKFQYENLKNVQFWLYDAETNQLITVLNGEGGQTYTAGSGILDLSGNHYTFKKDDRASDDFKTTGKGSVTTPTSSDTVTYTVYFEKATRNVTYIAMDSDKLSQNDFATATPEQKNAAKINVTPAVMPAARVGETYMATAQTFDGWTLDDDLTKPYTVEDGRGNLEVYFWYKVRATGTVTVNYVFGTEGGANNDTLASYTTKAAGGEKLTITPPQTLGDGRYTLNAGQTEQTIDVDRNGTHTVNFYYSKNFVTINTKIVLGNTAASQLSSLEVLKTGTADFFPPYRPGYKLVGVTGVDGGTATKLPDGFNDKVTVSNPQADMDITWYYEQTDATEYQSTVTVKYIYRGLALSKETAVKVFIGVDNTIEVPAFDGYTAKTYTFKDGSGTESAATAITNASAGIAVKPNEKTATLTITYERTDGSIVLPGKDNEIAPPKDKDNVTVTPDDQNKPLVPKDDGSVEVPADSTATVTRPTDPDQPDKGKEDITVPGGSVVKPDGTIVLPKEPDGTGGDEIGPDKNIPDDLPESYVAITYDSNNGSKEVKKEIGKKGELKVKGSLFTHPNNAKFVEWNSSGLGSGTAYAEGKTVNDSIKLYAKWSADYKYRATITYKPNGGTPDQEVFQKVGHDTDPNLKATLQNSPFQLSGWLFGGWCEAANGTDTLYQPNAILSLQNGDAKEFHAQWYKVGADGSITVPGKDGNPKNADTNATAKGNGTDAPKRDEATGNIEIPNGGSVTLPDGSVIGMPDGGVLKPDGTVIINRPDDSGTITIPGKDGTNPDVTDKDGNAETDVKVITLVYTINNGESNDEVEVKVVKGDTVSILDCPFTWTGHKFVNWMGTDNLEYAPGANYTAGDTDLELHAQWIKVNGDGSAELPGKDGSIVDADDNVIVTPDKPNGTLIEQPGGGVKVDGNGGTVNRPKDPDHPENGREDIKVPEGTIVEPDGTIKLPDNGGTIKPGDKLPDATPAGYVSVTYKANGGTGDDVVCLIKNGETITAINNPFAKNGDTFSGWNTTENGIGGTAYAAGSEITVPNNSNSITLYAQWSKTNYNHSAKITYQANDGVTSAIEDTVGANDSTEFSINLRSNPFSVSGWDFGGWNTKADGTGTLKAANAIVEVEAGKDQTWFAQWYKIGNGSITVPGDGNPNTEGDNVTANGDGKGNNPTRDNTTGNIDIPAGGTVVKGNGETISLPDGGVLKPDGSLSINKPNGGGTIDVDKDGNTTDPDADVVVLTYEANNGSNDTVKVYAAKGEAIAPLAANTFSYNGHTFLYWKSGNDIVKTTDTITPTDAMTLTAVWAKVNNDGSIELPGKDGELEAPQDKDNVIVTPADPDNGGSLTPQPDGSVKVDDNNGGTVTRPDPANPDNKEEIKVPNGTEVEPDGTIKLPDGTVIDPDKRVPDDVTPKNYYVVTYEPGDGSGDMVRQIIAKNTDTTLLGADTFTAPNGKTFDGWLDEDQNSHDAGDQLTVDKSMTFTAKWKDGTPTPPAQNYSADIVFDSNNGDTATQTVTSSDSETITRNLDPYTQHFTAPTDWTFMGWSTAKAASQSSTFYKDEAKVTLKDGDTLNLYAIVYKVDADTDIITLPGKGGQPDDGDDVTVTPGADTDLTVKEGYIEAPAGSEIKQPASNDPIKVIEGSVNVYPDGSVYVPDGSKVQLPDGTVVDGEATIDPDGNPDTDNTKPIQRPDGTIVLPGENGKTGDADDITIAPAGPNQPAGRIDEDGNVTITNPDGADVNLPGNTPEDIKVPNGTIIKPNGDMTLLYTIRYVDSNGTEIKTATVKPVQRGIPETVAALTINGYTLSGAATQTASGEVSANLADYTITFTYTKNSSGGGSSGGGGGSSSGGSVSSSFVIKASAGNGGIITPSGNVTVARGKDQSFTINPINGYRISNVIVDGKSVGTVSTYTFDSVKANHTIEVKFTKLNSIVADPETTGVAGWLQTRDHIAYLGGYGSGLFGPNDNMTRAQAAQMFYNLLLNKDVDITVNFTDVPADAWYGKAVHTLASLGIIAGIGNNQFAPDRTITRAEFTVIAMRFANLSADVTNPFSDVSENDWFYSAVTSAVSYGWIGGYSDGTFRARATITRAEVATIVNRMLARTADRNFVDGSAVTRFSDVPSTYWAYYNIMEATNAHTHTIDNDGVESWTKLK